MCLSHLEDSSADMPYIPFEYLPAQVLGVLLPFLDVTLPVPAGCDCSGIHGGMQKEFASDLLFPWFYG